MSKTFISRISLFIAMFIICLNAVAYDFKSGDLCYNIISTADKSLSITYEKRPDSYVASYKSLPSQVVIPSTVRYNGETWTVSQIGDYAFRECRELKSITFPNTIQSIGVMAFESCTSISSIIFPESLAIINFSAFLNCKNLQKIESYAEVPPICFGTDVFKFNKQSNMSTDFCQVYVQGKSVESYQHANGWRDLPINSFVKDASQTLYFRLVQGTNNDVMLVPSDDMLYYGDIIIPESFVSEGRTYYVTGIWNDAFANCTNLTSVVIPDCVTYIGDNAFMNCKKITSVKIPVNVSYIGTNSFKGCTELRTIDYFCRTGWNSDTGVEAPLWSKPPFADCPNIREINFGTTVEEIPEDLFKTTGITEVKIPDNVRVINADVFASCLQLKEITIGKNVEKMIDTCFGFNSSEKGVAETLYFNATNLKEYSGLQNYWYPFVNSPLNKIVFGENVESLPKNAFKECTNLRSIVVNAKTPPTCDVNCFANVNKSTCVLYVPSISLNLYRTASTWKNFANILPIDDASSLWYISDNELENSYNAKLDIYTKPMGNIVAFQCDIKLPEGLSIASENDNLLINKGSICSNSHMISSTKLDDNTYRIVCYSLSNQTFRNDDGKLFTLQLNCTNATIGSNEIELYNIHISDRKSNDITISPLFSTLNIKERTMIKGDANGDGTISIVDVVTIVNKTLDKVLQSFVPKSADVNNDGIITISDAVGVINLILKPNYSSRCSAQSLLKANSSESVDNLFINDFSISKGEEMLLNINLDNSNRYSAFQFDIELPRGLEILKNSNGEMMFELTDRADRTHSIVSAKQSDGKFRVVSFSTSSALFSMSSGSIVTVRVKATDDLETNSQIQLSNIRFTTDTANEIILPETTANIIRTSGIDKIECTEENAVYFDLSGHPVETPSHGIFIEVMGNKANKVVIP